MLLLLVIDDNDDIREMVASEIAHDLRFTLVGDASTAETGLHLASQLQPDAIVLDQSMPGMTGMQALPQLRQACPNAHIVIWSSVDVDVTEALAAGATACQPKGVPLATLLDSVVGSRTIDLTDGESTEPPLSEPKGGGFVQ